MTALPIELDRGHRRLESQTPTAAVDLLPAEPTIAAQPKGESARLAYSLLALYADQLDDFEALRIAQQNRLRALAEYAPPADPTLARIEATVDALAALEHGAELELKRALRKHPLGPWVKATVGVGEKQGARLLAAIGDPYWNTLHDRPRTISELWAYCGLHVLHLGRGPLDTQPPIAEVDPSSDPGLVARDARRPAAGVAARRKRGECANWSTTAKSRAYLVAVACMKQRRSAYRKAYDDRRAHTAVTHPEWTDGHSHNDALRITSKAILRDLWIESRRLHVGCVTQSGCEAADS